MRFDILTLFPQMFESPLRESILKRALEQGLISIAIHDIRDYATDKHRTTDDAPYGGGGGMVMKPEPMFRAVEAILGPNPSPQAPIVLLSPQRASRDPLHQQCLAMATEESGHIVVAKHRQK